MPRAKEEREKSVGDRGPWTGSGTARSHRCPRLRLGMTWLLSGPSAGMPTFNWVGRVGPGRHGGEASALCVGSDDVGLDSLVL